MPRNSKLFLWIPGSEQNSKDTAIIFHEDLWPWADFSKPFPILHLITSYKKKTFRISRTSSDMGSKKFKYSVLNSVTKGTHIQEGFAICLNLPSQRWLLIPSKSDMVLASWVTVKIYMVLGSGIPYFSTRETYWFTFCFAFFPSQNVICPAFSCMRPVRTHCMLLLGISSDNITCILISTWPGIP